ncbi:MAG: 2TM domain-containing protein [Planctomycetota bacterium]
MGVASRRHDYEAAAVRVAGRIAFYAHLTWFFWFGLAFLATDALITPGAWWSLVVIGFWAIAVFTHLISAFFIGDLEGPVRDRLLATQLDRSGPSDIGSSDTGPSDTGSSDTGPPSDLGRR